MPLARFPLGRSSDYLGELIENEKIHALAAREMTAIFFSLAMACRF